MTLSTCLWLSSLSEFNASSGDLFDLVDEFHVASELAALQRTPDELQFIGGCSHSNKRLIALTPGGIVRS
ncbi:hypothetical protein EMIT0P2_10172 [Pseudomonas sp. IT-P2]